ncbi:MAG: 50S ribosomal protein L29 [Candidatus Aenigmarchaeota archaeon]|nr:50S ribosomal protein L29 [Candidatus Aenigmarchaeota archaeon]
MKIKEIRAIDKKELSKKLSELRLELVKEIANVKRGRPIKNPGKIRVLKKSIARVLTVKNQKAVVKK